MPKEGWKAVTISTDMYANAEKFIIEYNYERGMKEIRSMAHLVEMAIREYIKNHSKG